MSSNWLPKQQDASLGQRLREFQRRTFSSSARRSANESRIGGSLRTGPSSIKAKKLIRCLLANVVSMLAAFLQKFVQLPPTTQLDETPPVASSNRPHWAIVGLGR